MYWRIHVSQTFDATQLKSQPKDNWWDDGVFTGTAVLLGQRNGTGMQQKRGLNINTDHGILRQKKVIYHPQTRDKRLAQ